MESDSDNEELIAKEKQKVRELKDELKAARRTIADLEQPNLSPREQVAHSSAREHAALERELRQLQIDHQDAQLKLTEAEGEREIIAEELDAAHQKIDELSLTLQELSTKYRSPERAKAAPTLRARSRSEGSVSPLENFRRGRLRQIEGDDVVEVSGTLRNDDESEAISVGREGEQLDASSELMIARTTTHHSKAHPTEMALRTASGQKSRLPRRSYRLPTDSADNSFHNALGDPIPTKRAVHESEVKDMTVVAQESQANFERSQDSGFLSLLNVCSGIDSDKIHGLVMLPYVVRLKIYELEEVAANRQKKWGSNNYRPLTSRCLRAIVRPDAHYWTKKDPGSYACLTCTNQQQPCVRGNTLTGSRELLPLTPEVRDPDATIENTSYFIHPTRGVCDARDRKSDAARLRLLWQAKKGNKTNVSSSS
ncbi:hypothetical protein LTS10_006830 [Elasticomyces elasticus]|nr:hypothetical protein LTS10_006830 [Elasticomyces elasticus]